jgi:DNA polymerase III subunit delta'
LATDQNNPDTDLDSFLGNARIVEILRRAVSQDRLPNALIFAGPSGVGKRTLAILLAKFVNCLEGNGKTICGKCSSCNKIHAGTHPDVREIQPEGATIRIDQIRSVINEVAYQPFEARYRVVIIDPADQMQLAAANCILKTLEEPPSRTIIILITTNPYMLLETIRSRSRLLQFAGIPQNQIEEYLVKVEGRSRQDSRLAAVFSGGSLGSALAFNTSEFKEIRSQALEFTRLLLSGGNFAALSALSSALAKQKDSFQDWVEAFGAILQDIYYAKIDPRRIGQQDILEDVNGIASSTSRSAIVASIDGLKQLKGALRRNANRQLALESLFLAQNRGRTTVNHCK